MDLKYYIEFINITSEPIDFPHEEGIVTASLYKLLSHKKKKKIDVTFPEHLQGCTKTVHEAFTDITAMVISYITQRVDG